jgi:hypothetical protein
VIRFRASDWVCTFRKLLSASVRCFECSAKMASR